MKAFFLPLLIFCTGLCGWAQEQPKPLAKLPYGNNKFTTDNQANVYVLDKNELIKFNREGKQLYRYSNKRLGEVVLPDAGNMLKLLLYYPAFAQVEFLDNTLSANGEPLSFDKLGYASVYLVCSSHNNGMWIYDPLNAGLYQLSPSYEVVQKNTNLNAILNMQLEPKQLVEYDNRVYLNNPTTGILEFDIYGTYHKSFPLRNIAHFQVFGSWLYYLNEGKLLAVEINTGEEKQFVCPVSNVQAFRIEMNTLVLQTPEAIYIYSKE